MTVVIKKYVLDVKWIFQCAQKSSSYNFQNQSLKNSTKSNLLLYVITAFIAFKEFPKLAQFKISNFIQVNTVPTVAK